MSDDMKLSALLLANIDYDSLPMPRVAVVNVSSIRLKLAGVLLLGANLTDLWI